MRLTTKERIMTVRLSEKISAYPAFAKSIGLQDNGVKKQIVISISHGERR